MTDLKVDDAPGAESGEQPADQDRSRTAKAKRWAVGAVSALGVAGAAYGIDLAATSGEVPRDVVVAGVDVGGMDTADAERALKSKLAPNLGKPMTVRAAGRTTTVDARAAGVTVDWKATVDRASERSYNPVDRLASFFSDRDVDVVAKGNDKAVSGALTTFAGQIDKRRQEGTIAFDGTTPRPVEPSPGRKLDVPATTNRVLTQWAAGRPVDAKVDALPVKASADGVRQSVDKVAKPAVAAPVTVHAKDVTATLQPEQIASVMTFSPNDDGTLKPQVDAGKLRGAIGRQVARTERRPKDATFAFHGKKAPVTRSMPGNEVDYPRTGQAIADVLTRSNGRDVQAAYHQTQPKNSTEALQKLGVKQVIGEFTTGGFAYDSGLNIKRIAKDVNGAIIRPHQTFSLNGFTGPRGVKQGYVEAGVIENGIPARAVGGGISQFATTLYNASYFAAMTDVEHKEHSFYISRYPMGREATVFQNPDGTSVIDLKFRNDFDTGVVIQTKWTPTNLTVRLWGTKHVKVSSQTSAPFAFTSAPVRNMQGDPKCHEQNGVGGWSVNNTRIIRRLDGSEVKREKRTVVYNPQPKIVCKTPGKTDADGGQQNDAGSGAANDGSAGNALRSGQGSAEPRQSGGH